MQCVLLIISLITTKNFISIFFTKAAGFDVLYLDVYWTMYSVLL